MVIVDRVVEVKTKATNGTPVQPEKVVQETPVESESVEEKPRRSRKSKDE